MASDRGYVPTRGSAGGRGSLIDRDSHFNGVFRTSRDLDIEGEYEGEIVCEGTLTIAATARVSGAVNASAVSVAGMLQGEINCSSRFEILTSGQVSAQVVAGSVVIREGAFYEGEMRMGVEPDGLSPRETTTAALAHLPRGSGPRNGREAAPAESAAVES